MKTLEIIQLLAAKNPDCKSFVLKANAHGFARISTEVVSHYGHWNVLVGKDGESDDPYNLKNWIKFEIDGIKYQVYQQGLIAPETEDCFISEFKRNLNA